jgi:hypothetical protein
MTSAKYEHPQKAVAVPDDTFYCSVLGRVTANKECVE